MGSYEVESRKPCLKAPIVDSGAVRSVCPPGYCPSVPAVKTVEKRLRGVTGHTAEYYGDKKVTGSVRLSDGAEAGVETNYAVMKVFRPVMAVRECYDSGKAVWFSPSKGCGVAKDADFHLQVTGPHIPLYPRAGLFEMHVNANTVDATEVYAGDDGEDENEETLNPER